MGDENLNKFTNPLEVQFVGDGLWCTLRAFTYWTRCDDSVTEAPLSSRCRLKITVAERFLTDFASIPAIAWPLIGHPAGQYAQAAVLHDWLYAYGGVTRREADDIFYEAMGVLGVPWWKRSLMWMAVRAAGGLFYKGKK